MTDPIIILAFRPLVYIPDAPLHDPDTCHSLIAFFSLALRTFLSRANSSVS